MKKRVLAAAAAVGALTLLVPVAAHASAKPAQASPVCIVVNLGNGATIQIGYAPTGPSGCTQV